MDWVLENILDPWGPTSQSTRFPPPPPKGPGHFAFSFQDSRYSRLQNRLHLLLQAQFHCATITGSPYMYLTIAGQAWLDLFYQSCEPKAPFSSHNIRDVLLRIVQYCTPIFTGHFTLPRINSCYSKYHPNKAL
jgi:hypothetical protein